MNFEDFDWHDAIIKEVLIDRSNPGILDEIVFTIEWTEKKGKVKFIFKDIYWANMNLNFGIVADETILNAFSMNDDDEDLAFLYSKWKGMINNIKLNSYIINLNSTGGQIKIIAKSFMVIEI